MPVEMTTDPVEGLDGPFFSQELLKKSDHLKEWRRRYVVLRTRRLYYYDTKEEAEADGGSACKGWLDVTGATITVSQETDTIDDGLDGDPIHTVMVEEEYGLQGSGEEGSGASMVLGSYGKEDAENLAEALRYGSRPRWLSDEYSEVCMHSADPFTFLDRRHHCRRCGGLFAYGSTTEAAHPHLNYPERVLTCVPCAEGARASRWLTKTPITERSSKPSAGATITENVKSTLIDSVNTLTGFIERLA